MIWIHRQLSFVFEDSILLAFIRKNRLNAVDDIYEVMSRVDGMRHLFNREVTAPSLKKDPFELLTVGRDIKDVQCSWLIVSHFRKANTIPLL